MPALAQDQGIDLAVRIGIHSGLVGVGNIGGGTRQERLALGETPNIAARLQSLTTPGRMVLSEQTQRLVGGIFDYDDVTTHTLKGLTDAVRVYWVHGASAAESRFEAATAIGLTPLVGRDVEIDLLLRRWEQVREGEGQVVLLSGEAGIGKSRITQALRQRLSDEPHLRLRAQCLPYYSNSAFYPFIAHLERAMACERDAPPTEKLDALEALLARAGTPLEEVVPLLAALLSIPTGDRYAPLTMSPQRQKDKTIEALIDQVRDLAQQQSVLNIFEDVHWIDPTSPAIPGARQILADVMTGSPRALTPRTSRGQGATRRARVTPERSAAAAWKMTTGMHKASLHAYHRRIPLTSKARCQALSVKQSLWDIVEQLPPAQRDQVLDVRSFLVAANAYPSSRKIETETERCHIAEQAIQLRLVPASSLVGLTGLVSLGGDAVADTEALYNGDSCP